MADESTLIIRLAAWLGRSFGGTAPLFADFETEHFGIDLPPQVLQSPAVVAALEQAENAATRIEEAARDLEGTASTADELEILAGFLALGAALARNVVALDGLVSAVRGSITPATIPDATARAAAEHFADDLAKTMVDYAIGSAVTDQIPELGFILVLAGLLDWRVVPADPANALSFEYVHRRLQLERFKDLITDPETHFRDTLGWGAPSFDPSDVFLLATDFFEDEDDALAGVELGEPFLQLGSFRLQRDATLSPPGLQLSLKAEIGEDVEERFDIGDEWDLGLSGSLRLAGTIGGQVTPPFQIRLVPPSGEVTGTLRIFFERSETARPFEIVGGNGLLTISADNLRLGAGLEASWNPGDGAATINPLVSSEIDEVKLRIGTEDGDGFVGTILGAIDLEGEFDLALEWRAASGLTVRASGGVEIALPIHKSLGPVELQTIYLSLSIRDDGTLTLEASGALAANLGPLTASVDRLGALFSIRLSEGADADFGPFDLGLGFKPPSGVGLAVDAGVVKGGGYLYFDFDREEYAGALELVFAEWLALKAIALITTRMPDGSKGFSLLIIITVEFGSGIQLGFGFTLLGVGGLLGLHRIAKIVPLTEGVRTGAIESVMFPKDVIANAPRIISDLRKFFPAQLNIFLVGPMAKIGWGTPTLVSVQLGIILEFPSVNITILGVIKVVLPDEKADILRLQVNFIGRIEPSNKLLWFYAELFDSRVLFITLEGGFGLLVNWGSNANFVISVGGFHPRYNPPALPFPEPPRLAVSLLNTSFARIRIEGYFAVTSNSVQFGARAEIYFGVSAFRIEGHLGFDVLFQFNPFFFSFGLSVSLSVKVFGIGLFSVGFSGLLEGPTPWYIKGKGKISILFFKISVPFSHTWGASKDTKLDPIDVYPLLEAEFNALTNWQAEVPANNRLLVSLRQLGETDTDRLVLHPVGRLLVSQRKVPVNFRLDKVGNQKPADYDRFEVDATLGGGGVLSVSKLEEQFAIGQFKDLDGSAKLSAPGFELLDGGIAIGMPGEQMKTSQAVRRVIRYESIVIDTAFRSHVIRFFHFFSTGFARLNEFFFTHFLVGNSATQSVLSKHQRDRMQPFDEKIEVHPHQYTVAFSTNNQPVDATTTTFNSRTAAEQYMEQQIADDGGMATQLHVIPNTEVNAGT